MHFFHLLLVKFINVTVVFVAMMKLIFSILLMAGLLFASDSCMGFEEDCWHFIQGFTMKEITNEQVSAGEYSMKTWGNGFVVYETIPLSTEDIHETDTLTLDLYMQNKNPYWGAVQLYAHCPSANLYNEYISEVQLRQLPENQWNTLEYNMPNIVIQALSGDHDDFRWRITLNAAPWTGPYYFDNMVFEQPLDVNIVSPEDITYTTTTVLLNYTSNGEACWYVLDGGSTNDLPSCTITYPHFLGSLTEGAHTLTLYAGDSAGNIVSDTVTFTVDTSAPEVSIISPENTIYATTAVPLDYTVSSDAEACWYTFNGGLAIPLSSCSNITLATIPEGTHTVTVYANDSVGNVGSDSVVFTIDTSGPDVTIVSPEHTTASVPLDYTVSSDAEACWYTFNGGLPVSLPLCANVTLASIADGTHTVAVHANDSVGNVGSDSLTFTIDT
jgi:hypothetical protein